ncbi:MAG TPA: tetratricopeptide repeat protein [Pyrinomonadaceae bacterium]|jgi:tetratricopeptide (TPR) repeat protein
MKKHLFVIAAVLAFGQATVFAQSSSPAASRKPAATPRPAPTATTTAGAQPTPRPRSERSGALDLSDYGVSIEPEPRLLVMMAALDAAGFDPTPPGREPSEFRALVRRDQENLDPELRARMRRFYDLNKLKDAAATPAGQAARYVSLAYALGPAPAFDAPPRSDDLFAGVLDVLDFAPLLREFYTKSGIAGRLPVYLAAHKAEGDRLRPQTAEMLRAVLTYLHTRPVTLTLERVPLKNQAAKPKKDAPPLFTTREHERRFRLVPDLLAVPGSINFRVIGDDYFAVVPQGLDPASSEVRRAYLQYVIDPVILRFNRDIALKRADIRGLLDERAKDAPAGVSMPDVFAAVARSLVAAADARMNFVARTRALTEQTSARLQRATEPERARVVKESQDDRATLEDELTAQLADAYERGAVLAFYFSEQLRDQEIAGFDFADFFSDMMTRVDIARERLRPAEYASARTRVAALRREAARAASNRTGAETRADQARAALDKSIADINQLLRAKNYTEAETRLRALLAENGGEPRIFFGLAQAASISASDAFVESVRDERLGRALANYRLAINSATSESDRPLISRAYTAMGRILAFLDRKDEAIKAFEAAISLGNVRDGAYTDAERELRELRP